MNKFLNSPMGSWFKAFATAVITLVVANGSLRNMDWIHVFDASLIAVMPVVINYLNPEDTRSGHGKE